ncbi:MAG: hypothetical protein DRP67_01035 [Candidatus Omnitrophota bacterium]|nr:MAG: hypothetical protein DRP67_01035 [Candidatus Omnitrophota bacterium]
MKSKILVFFIFFGIFVLGEKQKKVYRNVDYGYGVKYPSIATGKETPNGIRIKNIPSVTKDRNLKEKSLNIYLSENISEDSCLKLDSEAVESIITVINNRKVLIQRWPVISSGGHYWTMIKAKTSLRKNQCLTFELIFKYSSYPKHLPSAKNQGETKILYQIISTLFTFKPEERFLNVLFPNGNERLLSGKRYVIRWEAKNVKKVDILLVERKGKERIYATERLIVNDFITAGNNKYTWKIPQDIPPSKYALLILSDDGKRPVKDFSDGYFTIISNTLSIKEKEKMLSEMFNGKFVIKGNEIVSPSLEPYLHLYLERIVEGSFTTPYEKEYLFIVRLSGVPHAGGLSHAFLGVFDKNKNLSSPSIDINSIHDFSSQAHFGGDYVDFGFFSCKGITYILVISGRCPAGGVCCDNLASLLRVENGKFKVCQDVFRKILDMRGVLPKFRIKIKKDKILVYDWKRAGSDLKLVYSGRLYWDCKNCKFVGKLR